MGVLSGPMFEGARSQHFKSDNDKDGAHYNIYSIVSASVDALREIFPEGQANDLNFVLFSTSGVHGSYVTIEEIEAGLIKYGDDADFGDDGSPDDYCGDSLTVLIVQPRIVCTRYGNVKVRLADIPYLKTLRETSWAAVQTIGRRD